MTFLTVFIIYLAVAFLFFLGLLFGSLLEIRGLGDFAMLVVSVLFWPVTLIINIYTFIKSKNHKS